jgi:hypothetical protein
VACRGYLEAITWFEHTGRLTCYRKLEAAFEDERRFDSRMRMSRDRHARFDCGFHQ